MVWQSFVTELERVEVILSRRFNEADGQVIYKALNAMGTTDSEFEYAVNMLESIDIPKRDINLLAFFKGRVLEIRRQLSEKTANPDPEVRVSPEQSKLYGLTVAAASEKLRIIGKDAFVKWRDYFNKNWNALSGNELTEFLRLQYKSFAEFNVSHETTPGLREKYGLTMRKKVHSFPQDEYDKLILEQESVARYLENHPEESKNWNTEKHEVQEYYRILNLAKKEKLLNLQKDW